MKVIASELHLRAKFADSVAWKIEEVRSACGLLRQSNKKSILPLGHAGVGRRLQGAPAQEERRRHDIEFETRLPHRRERARNVGLLHVAEMKRNQGEVGRERSEFKPVRV